MWIGLYEPKESELAGIAEEFALHPLAVEDAVHAHQRPKLDIYRDSLFAVFKTVRYPHAAVTETNEIVETGEVMVFLGDCFVVTSATASTGRSSRSVSGCRQTRTCSPAVRRLSSTPSPTMSSTPTSRSPTPSRRTSRRSRSSPSPTSEVDAGRVYQVKRELMESVVLSTRSPSRCGTPGPS